MANENGQDDGGAGDAYARAMAAFQQIVAAATPILEQLPRNTELIAALQPTRETCAQAFAGEVAHEVAAAYEKLWSEQPPRVEPTPEQTMIDIAAAPSFAFAQDSDLARPFPRGYRQAGPYLTPGTVWLCWRYRRPEARAGLAFDGLVHLGDRWVWFPKPYRVLAGLPGR